MPTMPFAIWMARGCWASAFVSKFPRVAAVVVDVVREFFVKLAFNLFLFRTWYDYSDLLMASFCATLELLFHSQTKLSKRGSSGTKRGLLTARASRLTRVKVAPDRALDLVVAVVDAVAPIELATRWRLRICRAGSSKSLLIGHSGAFFGPSGVFNHPTVACFGTTHVVFWPQPPKIVT